MPQHPLDSMKQASGGAQRRAGDGQAGNGLGWLDSEERCLQQGFWLRTSMENYASGPLLKPWWLLPEASGPVICLAARVADYSTVSGTTKKGKALLPHSLSVSLFLNKPLALRLRHNLDHHHRFGKLRSPTATCRLPCRSRDCKHPTHTLCSLSMTARAERPRLAGPTGDAWWEEQQPDALAEMGDEDIKSTLSPPYLRRIQVLQSRRRGPS